MPLVCAGFFTCPVAPVHSRDAKHLALHLPRRPMMFAWLAAGFIAGLIARRAFTIPDAAPDAINTYIIYLALPAMILLRVPALEMNARALLPVGFAWLVVLGCAAVVLVLARAHRWPRDITGALLMVAPLSNSAYVGIPVTDALTAGSATPYAILYDQLGNFVALSVYGTLITVVFGQTERASVATIARRILLFPPFLTLLVALALGPGTLPPAVTVPLGWLGATMGPVAMFIVGVQLELTVPASLRRPLGYGLATCLVVAPGLALGAALVIGGGGEAARASILQAAMPPMITAALLAMAAGFSRRLTVAMVGIGSLISLLTVPLVAWLADGVV
ncbi:MAG: AEC family transporter [Pseudomonadota bacterium]